jgi:hypothetical protein
MILEYLFLGISGVNTIVYLKTNPAASLAWGVAFLVQLKYVN